MPKSSVDLLQTNKNFKNGIITGMMLAKEIRRKKKLKGSGFGIKEAIAVAAGPLGWVWLARNKNSEEVKQLKEKLEKYEPTKKQDDTSKKSKESKLSDEDLFIINELTKKASKDGKDKKDEKNGKDEVIEFDIDDFE